MKKIHNNLIIENLMKTDWINQFNEFQLEQIKKGIKSNVNVFIYTKKEFNWHQMLEIRLGLEAKVDVSIYAKSEYSWEQMKKIRKRLLKKNKFNWF